MMNESRSERWKSVPRSALRQPGVRGAGVLTWVTRAGAAGVAIGVAWWAYVLVRPLDAVETVVPGDVRVPVFVAPQGPAIAERRDRLARLTSSNYFDARREAWAARREEPAQSAGSETPESKGPASEAVSGAEAEGDPALYAGVTNEALPSDIKTALTGLALRGVMTSPEDGAALALVSRVHSGPNPLVSDVFRAGDEFEDAQHPQAKWRVLAVDVARRRVILQRAGSRAVLELHPASAPARMVTSEEPAAKSPSVRVEESTRADVARVLKEAGLEPAQIARLMDLVEMSPQEASASAALEALARASAAPASPEGADQDKPARRAPPAGLEAIAQILKSNPVKKPEPSGAEVRPDEAAESPK